MTSHKLLVSALLASSVFALAACGADKQEVKKINVEQSSKSSQSSESKDISRELDQKEDQSTTKESESDKKADDNVVKVQTPKEGDNSIDGNIEQINAVVRDIHQFTNGTESYYNSIISDLQKFNVKVDDSVKGPFGLYEHSDYQLVGVVVDDSRAKDDKGYTFILTVRTATTDRGEDADKIGRNAQKNLSAGNWSGTDQNVVYHLDRSEDGKSGTLKRTSPTQWW